MFRVTETNDRSQKIFMRLLLLLCLIFVAMSFGKTSAQVDTASRTHQMVMEEPVLGFLFNPSVVKYERIPSRMRDVCPGFCEGRWWVFAHLQTEGADYFIVSGMIPGRTGDIFGSAYWIKGAECRVTESTWLLSGIPPKSGYGEAKSTKDLPGFDAPDTCNQESLEWCHYVLRSEHDENILRGLTRDAIQRGIKAFGGEAEFKKRACSPSLISDISNTPIVQQELQKFCSAAR
jgi:hypothetical protein